MAPWSVPMWWWSTRTCLSHTAPCCGMRTRGCGRTRRRRRAPPPWTTSPRIGTGRTTRPASSLSTLLSTRRWITSRITPSSSAPAVALPRQLMRGSRSRAAAESRRTQTSTCTAPHALTPPRARRAARASWSCSLLRTCRRWRRRGSPRQAPRVSSTPKSRRRRGKQSSAASRRPAAATFPATLWRSLSATRRISRSSTVWSTVRRSRSRTGCCSWR
mmetsp:Transcript_73780/g.193541  ORF Transcript_73780/g.193541 Transcript_73780/m.193541 type:complete len:217 (-) Transcript_73780:221-871(-)